MNTKEEFIEKAYITKRAVMDQLNQKRIKYNWHEADVSVIEGVLARGDRKLADAIEMIYKKGCIFDSWTEYFNNSVWLESLDECGLDPAFYTTRERELDEIFPWDFLDCAAQFKDTSSFIALFHSRSKNSFVTPQSKKSHGKISFNSRSLVV